MPRRMEKLRTDKRGKRPINPNCIDPNHTKYQSNDSTLQAIADNASAVKIAGCVTAPIAAGTNLSRSNAQYAPKMKWVACRIRKSSKKFIVCRRTDALTGRRPSNDDFKARVDRRSVSNALFVGIYHYSGSRIQRLISTSAPCRYGV